MKRSLLAILLVICFQYSDAQNDSLPVYQRFPSVPPFHIMRLPDSTSFAKEDLKRRKPLVLILFSPDCDHCKHETTELLKNYELFKKAQIVMVSSLDFNSIKKFYDDFRIADYPTITMGRDGSYFLGTFFNNKIFPSVFIYNKKGKFVKSFLGSVSVEALAAEL